MKILIGIAITWLVLGLALAVASLILDGHGKTIRQRASDFLFAVCAWPVILLAAVAWGDEL